MPSRASSSRQSARADLSLRLFAPLAFRQVAQCQVTDGRPVQRLDVIAGGRERAAHLVIAAFMQSEARGLLAGRSPARPAAAAVSDSSIKVPLAKIAASSPLSGRARVAS